MIKYIWRSVLGQTLKEIQVVCVNDGSAGHTPEILNDFLIKHSNTVIVNQENMEAGIARNVGINAVCGEFIAFMDGDDYYPSNNVLECLYQRAIKENVSICGGSYSQDRNGVIVESFYGRRKWQVFEKNEIY